MELIIFGFQTSCRFMKKGLILFVYFVVSVLVVYAQKSHLDSLFFLPEYTDSVYRLQPAVPAFAPDYYTSLLYGVDYSKRTNRLNFNKFTLKSGIENKTGLFHLDSIVSTGWDEEKQIALRTSRQLVHLESGGKNMQIRNYEWSADEGHWLINEVQLFYFGEEGYLDSTEIQQYVTINYKLLIKTFYSYDDGCLQSEYTLEKFDEYGYWAKTGRTEYEYDSLKRLTNVYLQEWDDFNDHWSVYKLAEYSYDSLSNLISETGFDYDSYEMVATKKYELAYTYSTENILSECVEYIEGWNTGEFVPERKQVFSYDDALINLEKETFYNWNYDLDTWQEDIRLIYHNEPIGEQLHLVAEEEWNEQWIPIKKTIFFSDNSIGGDELENSEFFLNYMSFFIYDGVISDRIEKYRFENDVWVVSGNTIYYFSENTSINIASIKENQIKLYPNPVDYYLNIEYSDGYELTCVIRDLFGRKVKQTFIKGMYERLDLSSLQNGIYIVELYEMNKSGILKQKILKL